MNTTNQLQSDKSESPYFLIKNSQPKQATVALQSTQVDVQVDGVIADVTVRQSYVNEGRQKLEAVYVFAGSTRAAVYGLDMRIGEREIHAKVKERETARREYEQAKHAGKTAGLLEQHRPNVFQMNVANILPGDVIEVVMHYTELLEHRDGLYEFVYPGVVGPRYSTEGEQWVGQSIRQLTQPATDFNIKATINAGVPVQSVSCTSHQIRTEYNDERHTVVSLANPLDPQSDRDFILQYGLRGNTLQSGLMCYKHNDDEQFFLLMAQPPLQTTLEQVPPREFIFIVDVSASMYGFPLEVSKTILRKLLLSLRPTDIFNVMLFEFSRTLFSDRSLPATPENIRKALQLIGKQEGRGGTNLYQALQTAFDFRTTPDFARTFVIATDGHVTVENKAFQLVENQRNQANLFTLGIGSNVNRHLIEGLAYAGAGEAYIITNQTEAKTVGAKLINDIAMPVWSHIQVDWGDLDVQDVEPVSVPDLFASKPVIVYGKYRGNLSGKITLKGKTATGDFEQTIQAGNAEITQSEALRYLWARNRIKYLSDYASYFEDGVKFIFQDETPKHQQEITELGLKYNLLTKYTSFLAVDDDIRISPIFQKEDVFLFGTERPKAIFHAKFCKSTHFLGNGDVKKAAGLFDDEDFVETHPECQEIEYPPLKEEETIFKEEETIFAPNKNRLKKWIFMLLRKLKKYLKRCLHL
ncbi:MAG: VWA domain-containing protein [Candidatus Symbiothrix sp.]|nr:VWA domain-containing protein [Candidatus Symbiothrix sp.]